MNQMKVPEEFLNLREYLVTYHNGKRAAGGTQAIIRCPYCGDSRDPRNKHLYVGPDRKNEGILSYHCFLCDAGGVITTAFFRDIECYDIELINEVISYNHTFKKRLKYTKRVDSQTRYNFQPIIENEDSSEAFNKLDYINRRLGSRLTFQDLGRLKIILNLNRYLKDNHIGYTTRYPTIMQELSTNAIGFLSVDNTHVIMRTIVDPKTLNPAIAQRYNNYSITVTGNSSTFYIIPGTIDPTKPITINIAEGPFDILSVYLNVVGPQPNHIFAASCGKAMFTSLMQYIFLQIGIPAYLSNIQLYSDSDVRQEELSKFKYNIGTKLKIPITLHRNTMEGEKDYGVPKDRIIDTIVGAL